MGRGWGLILSVFLVSFHVSDLLLEFGKYIGIVCVFLHLSQVIVTIVVVDVAQLLVVIRLERKGKKKLMYN